MIAFTRLRSHLASAANGTAVASSSRLVLPASIKAVPSPLQNPTPSSRRRLHGSPALDPKDEAASATSAAPPPLPPLASVSEGFGSEGLEDNIFEPEAQGSHSYSSGGSEQAGSALVYSRLSHIHPNTRQERKTFIPLSRYVFGIEPRKDIIHSAVVYHLDGLRSGTASTKSRGEVAYSGRKLAPQKGTGNARVGSAGSPTRRGGGRAHGPKPRDFATDLPRRVRELALRSALSARWREGKLFVISSYFWDPPPKVTDRLRARIAARGWQNVLFLSAPRSPVGAPRHNFRQLRGRFSALDPVYEGPAAIKSHDASVKNFKIALRNIPETDFIDLQHLTAQAHAAAKDPLDKHRPGELAAYEIIKRRHLVLDLGAVEWLEEKLGGAIFHAQEGEDQGPGGTLEEMLADAQAEDAETFAEVANSSSAEDVSDLISDEERVAGLAESGPPSDSPQAAAAEAAAAASSSQATASRG